MRIYLKTGAGEKLEALKNSVVSSKEIKVETDKNDGGLYIEVYQEPDDPTATFPTIPRNLIKRVTWRDEIQRGFVTDGIYKLGLATLAASYNEWSDGHNLVTQQFLNISAPSIKTARKIHTLVLQGKIQPTENWNPKQALAV